MANYVINPNSFSGNKTVTIDGTGVPNTGRNAKTKIVIFSADGVSPDIQRQFNHAGKPEFIEFQNGASISAPKGGGKVTLSGKSNSAKLNFVFVGDDLEATIATNYTAGGKSTVNGEAIEGDPGASAEYNFSMEVTVPANTTIEEVLRTVKVDNGGSISKQIQIEQAAGDPFLTVEPEEAQTMDWEGTAISFTVKSNTTVTVTIQ